MSATKFSPQDLKTCLIRVTGYRDKLISGTVSNACIEEEMYFNNQIQLFMMMDEMYDSFDCPQRAMSGRSFPDAGRTPIPQPRACHGEQKALATFKLRVLFRQNVSWQGTITWLEKKSEAQFRSVLELIGIIDSAFASESVE